MDKKISKIYRVANRCGFEVKHREESENTVFAFKSQECNLNLFFEVRAKNGEDEKTFRENVAHEVFLLSENMDPHTETRKYLDKIGGKLQKYTEIYSEMLQLCLQVRSLWFSL